MNIGPYILPGYYVGDCRELLRALPDGSINCCVTSPPYWGLRDYGNECQLGLEKTPEEYVAKMVDVFREVRRTLRDDGTLWLNLGDTYGATGNRNGLSGSTLRGGKDYGRGCTGEKPISGTETGFKPKNLVGIPWRVAFALQADGWYLRSDIIWHKPNPMPESVTDRPTKAHEYIFLLAKSERYYYDADAIAERAKYPSDNRAERTDTRKEIDPMCQDNGSRARTGSPTGETRNKRTVWTIPSESYRGAHFATFPTELIKPCVLAGCPTGGVILDPFMGSGTTGQVAEDLGRNWLGFDLSAEYADLAKKRTAQTGMKFHGIS